MAISRKTRFDILTRDKYTCQYCGRKALDLAVLEWLTDSVGFITTRQARS